MKDKYKFMQEALKQAIIAYEKDETPIGAVVVYEGEIVGRGYNCVESENSPLCHAEIMAINQATKKLNRWRLDGCELYVTMEPCFMCAGAIVNSRIKKIYVGAKHKKNHIVDKHNSYKIDYYKDSKVEIEFEILEEECSKILTDFFKKRRIENKM